MAGCEAKAYDAIGVQDERSAPIGWLGKKAELVRVCMVAQGFKFVQTGDWQSQVQHTSMNVYLKYGMEKIPFKDVPSWVMDEERRELQALSTRNMTSSANWSR